MTTAELLETVRRVEVRTNRASVAAGIRACRRAGHLARRKKPHCHLSHRNVREPQHLSAFVPGGRMPPSTSGKDARRYRSGAESRVVPDFKPIEFERFGNCGEFAMIRNLTGEISPVLIPSNSTGLEFKPAKECHD
jgi:hypothetical protein